MYLNYLANYIPNAWNYEKGCDICDHNMVDMSQLKVSPLPDTFPPPLKCVICLEKSATHSSYISKQTLG